MLSRGGASAGALGSPKEVWMEKRARPPAGERDVFGRQIGQNQGVQLPLARAYARTRAASME